MPSVTKIIFDNPVNTSLQVGDSIYFALDTDGVISTPEFAANVIDVGWNYVTIDKDPAVGSPISLGHYIFFSKRIEANETSLKGY